MNDRPSWTESRLGSRARLALWLAEIVGEGNVFTKGQVRETFPAVEQIDRRMRELRKLGWRIDNNADDPALKPHQLRLVTIGLPVWERGAAPTLPRGLTARARKQVLARDAFLCVSCGISAGETYDDQPHLTATLHAVAADDDYVTECARCRRGGVEGAGSADDVRAAIEDLDPASRDVLASWYSRGRRQPSPTDLAWSQLRRLPAPERERLGAWLVELGRKIN